MGAFKEPQGGELKNLYLDDDAAEAEKQAAGDYASWDLTERQLCDIELILNGAFSPLEGFLNRDDYEAVINGMRLSSGVRSPSAATAASWRAVPAGRQARATQAVSRERSSCGSGR